MNKKKVYLMIFTILLSLFAQIIVFASGVHYLPDVTREMSSPSYWTEGDEILLTYEEVENLNKETILAKGTNMYDLINLPDVVDGISLNEAVYKSSQADASYYLGWTFLESREKASQKDYDKIIENTQNPNAKKEQKVLYAVATQRTELRTFPSDIAIWDDPQDAEFDYQYLVGIRVNEPVVITSKSKDGKYYLAKSICCSGWISAETVAICKDKNEWLSAWNINKDDAFVVWGDKIYTETSATGTETSGLMLTMGTVLKRERDIDPGKLIDNRSVYNNYVVWLPVRKDDGSYSKKLTLISENENVSVGFLPLTKANLSKVAFSALGNTYGWGGNLYADDCSSYMRNVYKCFGIELARNTTWQTAMPAGKIDMQYMAKEERIKFLDALPFGAILYFSGHEMMFLGSQNGKYYVISAVGSIMQPENPSIRQRIRSTVVNTLDVKRANGNTWLDELTTVLVPYFDINENSLPGYEWYHDGVAFCLKKKFMQSESDKFFRPSQNITWAEFLELLFKMERTQVKEDASLYSDAVEWAKGSNLIYENDKDFIPTSAITREQLISVLYLYADLKGYDITMGEGVNLLLYDDAGNISEYAVSAMCYAVETGIISGKTKSTLNPKDNATKAELAVILHRFTEQNISEGVTNEN